MSLVISDPEHLLIHILATCVSSLENYLCRSSAWNCSGGFVVFSFFYVASILRRERSRGVRGFPEHGPAVGCGGTRAEGCRCLWRGLRVERAQGPGRGHLRPKRRPSVFFIL